MRRITDIKELRSIQMEILDDVHRFCEAEGLRYSLSSGTLIGAVRHQGYIPWDDDIDIYMLRTDYERFVKTYQNQQGRYRVLNPKKEPHYYYTFAKVVDAKERERIFRLKKLLYKIRRCKISYSNPLHSRLAYLCYRHLPVSVAMLERWIDRLIIKRKPTNMLCHMTEAGPTSPKGCFPVADMKKMIDMRFEDRTYKVMIGYDDYLCRTYGDYMKLPPEEQRATHQFEAYWL